MQEFTLEQVFTPASVAELTYVKRSKQEKKLLRGIRNPGMQIIIYGHSKVGKTTLLYNALKANGYKRITTRCTKGNTIEDILLDAFSQLGSFYVEQTSSSSEESIKGSFNFGMSLLGLGLNISSKEQENRVKKRIVEVQKNPSLLARLLGEAKHLWVVEDFHKLDKAPKEMLSQIMKVFMDSGKEYPMAKVIALGAVDTARQVVHLDSEMEDRVIEIHVPLMSPTELEELIANGTQLLGVKLSEEVTNKIIAYSCGLASVTHHLCSLTCEDAGVLKSRKPPLYEIQADHFTNAIDEYIESNSDTNKSIYEQAVKEVHKRKYESPKNLFKAIIKIDRESFSVYDVAEKLTLEFPDYKPVNLKKYLHELTLPERREVLRYNSNSDLFAFSSPFVKGYFMVQLTEQASFRSISILEAGDQIKKHLNEAFKSFQKDWEEEFFFGEPNYITTTRFDD